MKKARNRLYVFTGAVALASAALVVLMLLRVPPFYTFYQYCVRQAYWVLLLLLLPLLGLCALGGVAGVSFLKRQHKCGNAYVLVREKGCIGISGSSIAAVARMAAEENGDVIQAEVKMPAVSAYTKISLCCHIQIRDNRRWIEVAEDVRRCVRQRLSESFMLEEERVEVLVDECRASRGNRKRRLA